MIATTGFATGTHCGTGFCDGTGYPYADSHNHTAVFWDDDVVKLEDKTEKERARLENALKANSTMVLMMRVYKVSDRSAGHVKVRTYFKRMFNKSGYLPKRIRRIRCSKG